MCGIAGIYSHRTEPDKLASVKKMADAIRHRGMDGEGYWMNEANSVALGHRRLAILDLSENGAQPMHYLQDRYSIVFNGEIYNYKELKEFLVKAGYSFKSDTDTEVLIALYDLKGTNCLNELDGMFAFAIWDELKSELFCARDRFGEKPFFYYHIPGQAFYFASEMKSFWAIGLPKELSNDRVSLFLDNKLSDPNNLTTTFYRDIFQLDSSHYIIIKNLKEIRQQKYYSLDHVKKSENLSFEEASIQFYNLLKESVRLRLRSDVPVGSSLSGGLDSSSIVMLIDSLKDDSFTQNSFSARFEGFDRDEGYFINKVVKACNNIKNFEIWPDKEKFISEIDQIFYHQEEPFGSASIYAQWKVMELAKLNNITVLLDGQGADEYLAGYLPYYRLYLSELFYNNKKLYYNELRDYNNLRPLSRLGKVQSLRQRLGYIRRRIKGSEVPFPIGALKSKLKLDTLTDGLKVLLRYADRNSMAHSREVRLPFLDHKIVEFVYSLPETFLLNEGWTKLILRKGMSNLLPQEIAWRVDKVGFEPPQNKWMMGVVTDKLKGTVDEYLLDSKISSPSKNNFVSDWDYLMLAKLTNQVNNR